MWFFSPEAHSYSSEMGQIAAAEAMETAMSTAESSEGPPTAKEQRTRGSRNQKQLSPEKRTKQARLSQADVMQVMLRISSGAGIVEPGLNWGMKDM